MKLLYIFFLLIIVLFAVTYGTKKMEALNNVDLRSNPVMQQAEVLSDPSRYFRYIKCEDQTFKDLGFPSTGSPCQEDAVCKQHQPDGASFQMAPRLSCCPITQTCGEFIK